MASSVVVRPDVPFVEVERRLRDLGWRREAVVRATADLLPGEPELASFKKEDSGTRATYTFNPVVLLRCLALSGDGAATALAELASQVPLLDLAAIRSCLSSPDVRQLLLGLFAAREVNAWGALDLIAPLASHSDPHVVRAAAEASKVLTASLLTQGAVHLANLARKNPESSALFGYLGDAASRRQILRWIMRDRPDVGESIFKVLRAALSDADWECRATAMIAASRYRASDLWLDVKRTELPRTTREGPDSFDRSVLDELRRAVLERLSGQEPDRLSPQSQYLRDCLDGGAAPADGMAGRVFLLLHALTEPLEFGEPPGDLPRCVVSAESGFLLRSTGLPVRWVGAVPHWLGSADEDFIELNPVRKLDPASGFFLLESSVNRSLVDTDSGANLMTLDEALRTCARLSEAEGAPFVIPSADELEMAARGSDGRRYSWGNGFQGDVSALRTPWGLAGCTDGRTEWTTATDEPHVGWIAGGDRHRRVAWRSRASQGDVHVVRPLLRSVA